MKNLIIAFLIATIIGLSFGMMGETEARDRTYQAQINWYDDKVKNTPLAGTGKELVRFAKWDYENVVPLKSRRYFPTELSWVRYMVRLSYAVGKQETKLCTTQSARDYTRNCFNIHPSNSPKSYSRWDRSYACGDGVRRIAKIRKGKNYFFCNGSEAIRLYPNTTDAVRDFAHLIAKYYSIPILRSPVHMVYATDTTHRRKVVAFYRED